MLDYRLKFTLLKLASQRIFPVLSLKKFVKDRHLLLLALFIVILFAITPYVARISSLPENESKNIAISLQYAIDRAYDIDNNGIETINGVVDFTVKNTAFALSLNESYLSTRWEIYSLGDNISTALCYGSEIACNFVSLAPSSSSWNDNLYLYYGKYGAGYNNIVSAQVLYVNYNLSLENPFSEIYYSDWSNLSAIFVDIDENITENLTNLTQNLTSPINLTNISNNLPICSIPNLTITENSNLTVDLNDYCSDLDNDLLSYSYEDVKGMSLKIESSILTLIPDINITGTNITVSIYLILHVSDSKNISFYTIPILVKKDEVSAIAENATQFPAEIGKPVKWQQKIVVEENSTSSLNLTLPEAASNITVKVLNQTLQQEVADDKLKIIDDGKVKDKEFFELENDHEKVQREIGFVEEAMLEGASKVGVDEDELEENEISLKLSELYIEKLQLEQQLSQLSDEDLISNLSSGAGEAFADAPAQDAKENPILVINESFEKNTEITVEYETEAPFAIEEELSQHIKQIKIVSETSYTDILAYTGLNDIPQGAIKLFWLKNGTRELFENVIYIDRNNNSLIDKIEWIVPHLSNQTFEIELTILDVQSFPTVGGSWLVRFNTTGTANLTISASNLTAYAEKQDDDSSTISDLDVAELKCGDDVLFNYGDSVINDNVYLINENNEKIKINDTANKSIKIKSIFAEDYNCANKTGFWTVKVLTSGTHIQRFDFDGLTAYANNYALQGLVFVDNADTDFGQGTLHLTNISGSGAGANVTLNYTIQTGNMSGGHLIYNITGNFTSRIFDSGQNHTVYDKIAWKSTLENSSDVIGIALDNPGNNMTVFYRNGTHRMSNQSESVLNFVTNKNFTGKSFRYTLPAGISADDIVGTAVDDDGSDMVIALLRNGSAIRTVDMGANTLGQDLPFTVFSSYTLPVNFNTSDIIGFALDTGSVHIAVFFRNGSYVSDVDLIDDLPPYVFTNVNAYTLPANFNATDSIGVAFDNTANDIAMFFRNGSFVTDSGQGDLNSPILFTNGVFSAAYPADANITETTNITLQTRVSNDTSTIWTDWSSLYIDHEGTQTVSGGNGRYIQYKAVFTTIDRYITPILENVSINYTIDIIWPIVNSSINNTSPKFGEIVNFTANTSDTSGLSFCQFIDNQSASGAKRFFNISISSNNDKCSQNFTISRFRADVINFSLIINDTYNNKNQTDIIVIVANTPPNATVILFPINDSKTNQQPLPVNVTFFDTDNDIINISYYINGKLNQTSLTNTTLNASDGVYILNISLFDGFDTSQNTSINFTIDLTSPVVNTSLNKSITNIVFGDVINLTANTTDLVGLSFGQIIVNNTGFVRYFNFSLKNSNTAQFSQNISINCYGGCVINFTARANDTSNNFKTNETIITVFDNINPQANASINNSAPKINEIVNITANVSDEVALSFCQFIDNQSLANGAKTFFNKTITGSNDQCSQNYTIRISRASVINFTIIVNDTANNPNQTEQIITVANTAPSAATILFPTNNSNTSQQPLPLNVTFASDVDSDSVNISYYINGTLNQTSATNTTFNASDGLYVLNVSLTDGFNPSPNSSIQFSLDTTPPRIFLESPGNNTWNNSINITFRYNVSDNLLGTKNCTLILDNKANITNSTIIQGASQYFNVTLNDTYGINWSVNCTDYIENKNSSEIRIIKIDTSFPSIINASINMTNVSVNSKICLNATVNDTISMIESVYAEIDRPVSDNINISLTNDTANSNSCAGFGGSVWSFAFTALEEGEANWTTTYVRDFASNINSSKTFGLNWSQIAKIFINSTILQPLANFELNESDLDINYSFTMRCNATCRDDSTSPCSEVAIIPQYFNDSWNDITNFSSQLFTYQMNKSCGNIAIGEHCNATFNVTSSIFSGNKNFSLRCKAKGSNTPNDFSILTPNVTINDHPTASFTYPTNTQHIRGIIIINSSSSTDDQNISRYVIELDNNNIFSSPSLLCDNNQSNCTFNTQTQTQCIEDTPNCYLRLNVTDIDNLKNSTYIQIQIDNTAPSVRLEAPLNNTYSLTSLIDFNYTAFDTNLSTCSLYHNETGVFVRNETNETVKNDTKDTITITLIDNLLIWNVGCNDTAGNFAFNASNFTLLVDTLTPKINFTNPTLPNNTYTTGNYISVNVSVNETNFANITFYLYNSSLNLVNETNFTVQTFFLNFSNLADTNELYYYNVTVRDRATRLNSTETRIIILDNTYPKINFTKPTESNNTYFNRNYILVNVTVNDTNFANATFYLYDQSLTLVNETNMTSIDSPSNLSINFTPSNLNQRYYYNATVRDRANLINYTETRQLTLDNTTPAIGLISPVNNTLTKNSTINFTYYLVETNIKNCTLYANFSGAFAENVSDSAPLSGINNNLTVNISDGLYIWNVRCYDLAENNAFNSTNFTLDIDTTPPLAFNLDTPVNDTQSINRSPRLNWTEAIDLHFQNYTLLVDDNRDFSSIDFVYKLGGNSSNNTLFVNDSWPGNRVWYWKVIAYDALNQSTNSTDYFYYTIDNGTPQITLLTPLNHSVENQSIVNFNFNVTDESTVANCSLIINNELESTLTSIIKNISNEISFNFINGNYNWSVNCTDRAGNINASAFRNITVNAPALMPTKFIDTKEADFGQGSLYQTNITNVNVNNDINSANVTLNYTIDTGNMSGGHLIFNFTGNFTSRVFDTGATNTNLSSIKWGVSLGNSSDVIGIALDNPGNNMTIFYRNGTHRMSNESESVLNFVTNKNFTGKSFTYSLPAGITADDIVGIAAEDGGNDMVIALLRNGSAIRTVDMGTNTLGQDLPFTVFSSYTLPVNFNTSDIIGFAIDTGTVHIAVFFRNGSYISDVDLASELPPYVFTNVNSYALPAGFDAKDAIGVAFDNTANDIAMFFRNGSFVTDSGQGDLNSPILFTNGVFSAAYPADANITETTNITLQTRVSNDSVTFTDWSSIYDNFTGQPMQTTTARYIQYKAVFSTPDKYITPNLENVSINYTERNNPRINFTFPTPQNNSFVNANYIYINVSIFDEHSIDICTLEFNGINESMFILRDGRNTTCFMNKSSLAEGKHGFKAYANDTFGNTNITDTRNVTIDLTSPTVALFVISPNPVNYTYNNATVNFTASDLYLNETIANVSYPNRTTFSTYTTNFTLTPINLSVPGNYSITIFANDTAGNRITNTKYLLVNDITVPNVTLISPGNNTITNNATVIFYYTPKDDFNVSNCTLILNNKLNVTNYTIEETIPNNFTLNLSDGRYEWSVNCTDSYFNINGSETRILTVDTNPPNITLIFPVNDFNSSIDIINFNWTMIDNLDSNITCNLTINNLIVGVNITNLTGNYSNFTVVNLTEGANFWNATCIDDANNTNASITRNFTIIKGPSILNITLIDDNESINLSWISVPYAQSYNIYIIDNFADNFGPTANVSGILDANYTDTNAGNKTQRFYKIAAVKGSVNKTTIKIVGKYEFELINNSNAITDWNLISLPLNITNFVLNNGSNNGSDLRVKPLQCIKSLWFYNASIGEFKRTDYNGSAWIPAAGSENFTSLETGRGYWAEVNQTCNLTFVGEVPTSNVTTNLSNNATPTWQVVGWYSTNSSRLPTNYQPSYPVAVNPANSVKAINRYNPVTDRFEVTIHFVVSGADWGWFPSANNRDFTALDPARGYYFDVINNATWTHKPNTEKD